MTKKRPREGYKQVAMYFPLDVIEGMRHLAEQHQRSLVGEVVWALREYIARQKSEQASRLS